MQYAQETAGILFGPGNAKSLVCPVCYAELGWPHADTQVLFPLYATRPRDVYCSPAIGCGRQLGRDNE